MTCGGGCGGGFGGCGFATGIGNYTKPKTEQTNNTSDQPEYEPFAAFVGLILFIVMITGGLIVAAEVAEAKTPLSPELGHHRVLR